MRRAHGIVGSLVLLSLVAVASPARAGTPADREGDLELRVRAAGALLSEAKEKNLRAKARLSLLRAAQLGTATLARSADEALAHSVSP